MWLTVMNGPRAGTAVALPARRFTVGRDPSCDLMLPDAQVSRRHAEIAPDANGDPAIRDLGSENGIVINGRRLQAPLVLRGGEVVILGVTRLQASREPLERLGPPRVGARPSSVERQNVRRLAVGALVGAGAALVTALAVVFVTIGGLMSPQAMTIAEIARAARPSTVAVTATRGGMPVGGGSGWVYDSSRELIVTNYHVVQEGDAWEVEVDGEQRPALLLAAAPCEDLVLLQVGGTSGLQTLELAEPGSVEQGDTVVALGFPTNLSDRSELTTNSGVVSVVDTTIPAAGRQPRMESVIRHDAPINPGNSGGPLLNDRAQLVGVNTLIFRSANGTIIEGGSYAISADRVRQVADTLAEDSSLGWTGALVVDPAQSSSSYEQVGGLVITGVTDDSPAAAAGLGEEPVVLEAIDGVPLKDGLASYCELVGEFTSGATAVFRVHPVGGGAPRDVEVGFD